MEEIKILKNLIKNMKRRKIHYSLMVSWNRAECEGFNDGISACIEIINRKIKKLEKIPINGEKYLRVK